MGQTERDKRKIIHSLPRERVLFSIVADRNRDCGLRIRIRDLKNHNPDPETKELQSSIRIHCNVPFQANLSFIFVLLRNHKTLIA